MPQLRVDEPRFRKDLQSMNPVELLNLIEKLNTLALTARSKANRQRLGAMHQFALDEWRNKYYCERRKKETVTGTVR
jgi:hypothetical protein